MGAVKKFDLPKIPTLHLATWALYEQLIDCFKLLHGVLPKRSQPDPGSQEVG